ncbi:MAG: hypothetical protein ABSF71_34240 [Terriglobia bacterium]
MTTRIAVVILLLAGSALGQGSADNRGTEARHYPNLIHAELPLYPPLAWTAHITGSVEIQITVDKGSVVDAQVKSIDIQVIGPDNPPRNDLRTKLAVSPSLSNPTLANVKTWQFQPEGRTTFLVKYVYRIEGEETTLPENPKVELELPRLVKVTARPFKPTCSDCSE